MRVFVRGLAFIALAAAPACAQMAPPSPAPSDDQPPANTMAPSQDSPALSRKTTAPIKLPPSRIAPNLPLNPRERAVQMLNRFTYGPRPGDVEQVLAMGPDNWFQQQLNPSAIKDDALNRRLGDYPTLAMTPPQVLLAFPDRGMAQQVMDGKQPYPPDPLLASVYEVQVYKLQQEQARKNKIEPADPDARTKFQADIDAENAAQKKTDLATAARVGGELFALPKQQRMAAFDAMPPADRVAFANYVPGEQRNTLFADFSPREREAILSMQGGVGSSYRIYDELAQAKLLRAVLSERQLQEVMSDFWFNHFNVFEPKDSDQWYTTAYERDVIRPNALGKFRDLLLATAQSPAMMVYLDNWLSIGPDSLANGVNPANPKSKKGNRGLNENYGREVMELHTVGVNGGYTQADVTHLAAILTGWSVDSPNKAGPFQYDPRKHEPGVKEWFGYTIDDQGKVLAGPRGQPLPVIQFPGNVPDGMKQGYAALTILAQSPRTAHFISNLLAQRFLADAPPAALVDRMTATYLASDGDIKTVLKTLVSSPEFNSHRYFRNKVKMPEEFVASTFRATATDPQNPGALTNLLANQLGQPLYKALPPTGYYITADQWMNTQSLMARLNFADQLTHNHFANQKFDSPRVLALSLMNDPTAGSRFAASTPSAKPHSMPVSIADQTSSAGSTIALHVLEATLIEGEISPNTDHFIHSQMAEQPTSASTDTLNLLTALLIGSPEFQLH
jgi:uncharacterized protein (DUF1800 family)